MTQDLPSMTTEPPASALDMKLLGGVEFSWQGQPLPVSAPRMLALLAYLHLQGGASRPELEMMFWPGQGANAVRQGLYTLRRLPGAEHWLVQEGQQVTVCARSDVQDMPTALQAGQDDRVLDLLSAGPLLGHLSVTGSVEFSDWLEDRRSELHETRRAALRREATRHARQHNWAQARTHLHTLLALDPLDEHTSRDLMRLEQQSGHPDAALDVFETLRRTLHTELHTEPDAETLALLHELEGHDISGQNRARLLSPAHLPGLELDSLHGRTAELRDVLDTLKGRGRALVQGMAGMGKTRVAWAVAEHHLQAGQNVLWLELGGDPPEVLLPALTEPLGLKQVPPRPQPQPLHAALHDKEIRLVVLDNAANSYAASVLLEYLPPELPVLVSSRLRLPRLPTLTLHRLPRQDSIELIQGHLGEAPDPYSLDALCALLGDHPYALRLAAMTLHQSGRTPRELLQSLTDAPHALGAEHSIKALLDQSTAALNAESYEAYLGLGSLFTPQTTPELLALALRRDPDTTEQALYTLTQHGLTTREAQQGSDTVTFRMHELTWHDARAHAGLQTRTVVQAVRQYAQANTTTPEHLYAELPNLLAGAQYAEKYAPNELVPIMAGWLGGPYIASRGFPLGYMPLLKQATKLATRQEQWREAYLLTGKLGNVLQGLVGDHHQAIAAYLEAAAFASHAGLRIEQVRSLAVAGSLQSLHHLPEAAHTQALATQLAEQTQDIVCLIQVLQQQGISHAMSGRFIEAQEVFSYARKLLAPHLHSSHPRFKELRNQEMMVTGNLGHACMRLGKLDEALQLKREMLRLAQEEHEDFWAARAHQDMGEVLLLMHCHQPAREALLTSLELFRQLGAQVQEETVRKLLHSVPET